MHYNSSIDSRHKYPACIFEARFSLFRPRNQQQTGKKQCELGNTRLILLMTCCSAQEGVEVGKAQHNYSNYDDEDNKAR